MLRQRFGSLALAAAIAGFAAPSLPADSPAALYVDALDHLAAARFDDALELFGRAIEADPENARYRIARGAAFLFAERPDEAIPDLDRAVSLSDRSAEARMWRAAADRMRARFFTEVYPQATHDPFESTVGEVSAFWGQAFRAAEPGYEPPEAERLAMRGRLADLRRWFVERATGTADAVAATWQRGKARADAGDFAGAAPDVARALAARPDDPEVLHYHAGCRLAAGDLLGARAIYTRVLTAQTDFVPAYLGRAFAAARIGDAARARADLAAVAERDSKLAEANAAALERDLGAAAAPAGAAAQATLRAAAAARRRYDETYQTGLADRELAVARSPRDASALAALAAFLYEHVDVPRERVEPRGEPRLLRWQTADSQARELARSEEFADAALAIDPNHVRALLVKAAVRIWNLRFGDAEQLLKRALARSPDDAQVLGLLVDVLDVAAAQKRQFASALRSPDVVGSETRTEGDYEIHTTWWRYPSQDELAQADQLEREAEECLKLATEYLRRAVASRQGTAEGSEWAGVLAERLGDSPAARAAYEESVRLDPARASAWFHLADLCLALGDGAGALRARGEALNLIETTAAPWLQQAWREIERTRFATARQLLDEAGRRDPADARVPAYRAIALEADGKAKEADAEFRGALELEDARAELSGTTLRDGTAPVATDLIGLAIALRDRIGRRILAAGNPGAALDVFLKVIRLEPRLGRGQDREELPRALLPLPGREPLDAPVAEPVLVHLAWARIRAAEATVALGDSAHTKELLARVFAYAPSRINGFQSDRFRGPELYAHAILCRLALAEGNVDEAKLHAQMLPRKRLGVGPSKGAFPELEEVGSELQAEVARREQEARERGDERSDAWHPADPEQVAEETERILAAAGVTALAGGDPRAANLAVPLRVAVQSAVQMIVQPKSNRWREEVRYALQLLPEEQDRLRQAAEQFGSRRDPRFPQRDDAALYAALATCADDAAARTRALAVARGYPKEDLDRDLGERSGPPGPAPFTGAEGDPDAHYAKVCEAIGVPYLRPSDRFGASPENLMSLNVRAAVESIDAPKTPQWRDGVVGALGILAVQHAQSAARIGVLERQIGDLQQRAKSQPKLQAQMKARIEPLQRQLAEQDAARTRLDRALTVLKQEAAQAGLPAAELEAELARFGGGRRR